MKRILLIFSFIGFHAAISTAQTIDVDKELDYCHHQVTRALQALQPYDFAMMPRNILSTEGQRTPTWNCRKASAEEWCSGFWPGILWMDYGQEKSKVRSDKSKAGMPADWQRSTIPRWARCSRGRAK